MKHLDNVRGIILDLDGVIYRGNELVPGALEFMSFLAETNRRAVALTNHAGARASAYADKLRRLGIEMPEPDILTSAWATARYLQETSPGAGVYIVGSQALKDSLAEAGLLESPTPDYIVVGFDADLHYSKLLEAAKHLLKGAKLIGTNPDALLPTPEGPIPECGPTLSFLEFASGQKATVIGKPNPWIVREALDRLGMSNDEVIMVGDTLATDIAGGRAAGVRTVLVLTGNTREPHREATASVRDLQELKLLLGTAVKRG